MRKTLMILLSTAVIGTLPIIQSCKKKECPCQDPSNPECENYDPCYGKILPNAMFDVNDMCNGREGFIPEPCDTFTGAKAFFSAMEEGASYKWTFGNSSQVIQKKEFCLSFSDFLLDTNNYNKPIKVTLEVTKKPDTCFNQGDSIFVQSRNILPVRYVLWTGKFVGYFSTSPSKLDSIEIIYNNYYNPVTASWQDLFVGFPYKDSIKMVNHGNFDKQMTSFKQWRFSNEDYIYHDHDGMIYYDSKGTYSKDGRHYLKIKYQFKKSRNSPAETITFEGRKLL